MSQSDSHEPGRPPRSWVERNRFGRVGRVPTPLPLPIGAINTYLVLPAQGSDELTLIDTGVKTPDAFDALRRGFKEYGFTLEQVRRLLLTHAHMDHFGQAKRIRDASGCVVHASALEAERMRVGWSPTGDRSEQVISFFRSWGVPEAIARADLGMAGMARLLQDPIEVDEIVADGDRLEVGDWTLEVIETPGHCEGHVVYYERDTKTLFSGDHLLTDISPVPLLSFPKQPGEPRHKSLVNFFQSLARVEALDCAITFPAHGDAIHDHRALIAGYRLHHERRFLQFQRLLAEGPKTPYEIACSIFPRAVETQVVLVMSEVIGHIDVLEERGLVAVEREGGVERVRRVERPDAAPQGETA